MPRRCFVPNCFSGYEEKSKFYRENNLKEPILFKAPSDPDRLKQWQRNIPRLDRTLSSKNHVCEKHFSDKFIQRFFTTGQLPDEKEFLLPREVPRLTPDAVPTKFPDCPKYLSKRSPVKRKPPMNRLSGKPVAEKKCRRALASVLTPAESTLATSLTPTEPILDTTSVSTAEGTCDSVSDSQCATENALPIEDFTFDTLLMHDFVSESWSKVVINENNVRYLCWPSNEGQFLSKKYVDVARNLSVQLLFGNVVSHFIGYETLHCMTQFSELLAVVEKTNVCPGALLNKYQNCIGYMRHHDDEYCGKCKTTIGLANKLRKSRTITGRRINQNMKKKIRRLKERYTGGPLCAVLG